MLNSLGDMVYKGVLVGRSVITLASALSGRSKMLWTSLVACEWRWTRARPCLQVLEQMVESLGEN